MQKTRRKGKNRKKHMEKKNRTSALKKKQKKKIYRRHKTTRPDGFLEKKKCALQFFLYSSSLFSSLSYAALLIFLSLYLSLYERRYGSKKTRYTMRGRRNGSLHVWVRACECVGVCVRCTCTCAWCELKRVLMSIPSLLSSLCLSPVIIYVVS